MTVKEALDKIETLKVALKNARSPEEAMSILYEINRLEKEEVGG